MWDSLRLCVRDFKEGFKSPDMTTGKNYVGGGKSTQALRFAYWPLPLPCENTHHVEITKGR